MMFSEVYSLNQQHVAVCNANEEKPQWQCTAANHSMHNGQQVTYNNKCIAWTLMQLHIWYNMLSSRFSPNGILQLLSVLAHVPQ